MSSTPELADLLYDAMQANRDTFETAMPGKVVKYDSDRETVDVQPQFRRSLENEDGSFDDEDLPIIPDVPIGWPSGNGGACYVSFPLAAGDAGMLVFASRDIGMWRSTGQPSTTGDQRKHGLAGAWFVPALRPNSGKLGSGKVHASKVVIGESVMLGAANLTELTMGAVNGEAVDAYTGMTQWQLGNASSVVFVKKA